MSVQAEGRFWSGIDVPKTIAGTLAAVSAAVLGSFLGVAGTLIGAALASVVSSIGTEVYHRSIDRGSKRLQSAFVIAPAAVGTPSVEAAADDSPADVPAAHEEAAEEKTADAGGAGASTAPETATAAPGRRIRWKRVMLVAGAFFLLGIGTLTTAELFAGRSAADVTSGRDSGSPTITFDGVSKDSKNDEGEPAPAPQKSSAPSRGTSPAPASKKPATEAPVTQTPATPDETTQKPTTTAPTGTPPAADQPETGEVDKGATDQGTTNKGATDQGETDKVVPEG
ncbi:hypothetical protein QLQ12_21975 [Actinoplanes sp. NEAU-A12]|uniref:Uncharacterized protein n=1 Tax=Actinoplanes sandaracinus TaxID=3045177 RepID=A0ABT6WNJ5_9ACTN|nr:hypothetical protein [Actinoplanes sandaracinus]MDI6101287.1 hypothetical protein [Actinoplanes sandaracinus]